MRKDANMSEQSARIDAKQAAELIGCSTRHVQKQIKDGRLSSTRDKGNKYLIDKSEFYRVYPDLMVRTATNKADIISEKDDFRVNLLKEENAFLKEQLNAANNEKKQILSALDNAQRLIEFKPKKRKKFLGIF
jgi:excisionase family DNA binding protein